MTGGALSVMARILEQELQARGLTLSRRECEATLERVLDRAAKLEPATRRPDAAPCDDRD